MCETGDRKFDEFIDGSERAIDIAIRLHAFGGDRKRPRQKATSSGSDSDDQLAALPAATRRRMDRSVMRQGDQPTQSTRYM